MPCILYRAFGVFVLTTAGLLFASFLSTGATSQQGGTRGLPVNLGDADKKSGIQDDFSPPGMVLIPKGKYCLGTTLKEAQEIEKYMKVGPRQKKRFWRQLNRELVEQKHRIIEIPAYYFDRFELTNIQYHRYMKAVGALAPKLPREHLLYWRGDRLPGSTQLLHMDEVHNWKGVINSIKPRESKKVTPRPGNRVWKLLDKALQAKLEKARKEQALDETVKIEVIEALNTMIQSKDFYDQVFWLGRQVTKEAARLSAKGIKDLKPEELTRFNRIHMDLAFPPGAVDRGQPREAMFMPVTGITFFQAKSCSEWMGKRLPTEAEFEKAGRGPANGDNPTRWFPWGSTFTDQDKDRCNWALYWADPKLNVDMKPEGLTPVWAFEKGKSPYNIMNLAGNALEYTSDSWKPHNNAPKRKGFRFSPVENPNKAVIKGGAYGEMFKESLRIAVRYPWNKREASDAIGFRCAKDVKLGRSALNKIAGDLFQSVWDKRITKLDLDHVACAQKVVYDEKVKSLPVINEYSWLGFVNITDHLYDSKKRLISESNKLKLKKEKGRIFIGILHTDIDFTDPPLKAGNYGIFFQKGFKTFIDPNKKGKEKAEEKKKAKGKKDRSKKKKDKKKKDKGKKKPSGKKDPKKKPGKKEGQEEPGGKAAGEKELGIPDYSKEDRILFVDASGKPLAAIPNPLIRVVRNQIDESKLTFHPPTGKTLATAVLHLALKQKYEKKKFLVLDLTLSSEDAARLRGWKFGR